MCQHFSNLCFLTLNRELLFNNERKEWTSEFFKRLLFITNGHTKLLRANLTTCIRSLVFRKITPGSFVTPLVLEIECLTKSIARSERATIMQPIFFKPSISITIGQTKFPGAFFYSLHF